MGPMVPLDPVGPVGQVGPVGLVGPSVRPLGLAGPPAVRPAGVRLKVWGSEGP